MTSVPLISRQQWLYLSLLAVLKEIKSFEGKYIIKTITKKLGKYSRSLHSAEKYPKNISKPHYASPE